MITEQIVESHPNGLQIMYNKLLEFVPHHCRLLREVTGGAISRYLAGVPELTSLSWWHLPAIVHSHCAPSWAGWARGTLQ